MGKIQLKATVEAERIVEKLWSESKEKYVIILESGLRIDVPEVFEEKYHPNKGDLFVCFGTLPSVMSEHFMATQPVMVMKPNDFEMLTIERLEVREESNCKCDSSLALDSVKEDSAEKTEYPIELEGGRLVYPAVLHTYDDKGNQLEAYPVTSKVSAALMEKIVAPSITVDEAERQALAACFRKGYFTSLDVDHEVIKLLLEKELIEEIKEPIKPRRFQLTDKGSVAV
ncbi:TPA: hypothetical protein ACVU5P_004209 [Vibrio parahaemolyticus]